MIPSARSSISISDHDTLEQKLGLIAERIKNQGRKRHLLARILSEVKKDSEIQIKDENNGIMEDLIARTVKRNPLDDISIAGIDGGVLNKSMHNLDLVLVRSLATIFRYRKGKLDGVDYHPNETPIPELFNVQDPLDSRELEVLVGLKRQLSEVNTCKETLKCKNIDILLMDGSIVPQYSNHVTKERTKKTSEKLLADFKELYELCIEKEVLLAGVIKDSRSTRITDIFRGEIFPRMIENEELSSKDISRFNGNKDILDNSRDTSFLDFLLRKGERSFVFKYTNGAANLFKRLEDWKNKIYAFYTKPVPFDLPIRVEFINLDQHISKNAKKICSIVNTLSGGHDACAIPSVLIEADARAALAKEEISILRDNIADRLEPNAILDLRRERRPF